MPVCLTTQKITVAPPPSYGLYVVRAIQEIRLRKTGLSYSQAIFGETANRFEISAGSCMSYYTLHTYLPGCLNILPCKFNHWFDQWRNGKRNWSEQRLIKEVSDKNKGKKRLRCSLPRARSAATIRCPQDPHPEDDFHCRASFLRTIRGLLCAHISGSWPVPVGPIEAFGWSGRKPIRPRSE